MAFWDFLSVGKQAGSAIAEPIKVVGDIIDACYTSDEEKDQAKAIMMKIQQQPMMVQAKINELQVQHRSIFVAGARPFILWVCGVGLSFSFVINPCIQWYTSKPGPVLPLDTIMELVIALLGLGGLRTIEKIKGVAK